MEICFRVSVCFAFMGIGYVLGWLDRARIAREESQSDLTKPNE